jgi:hypothetical protein
LRRVDGIIDPGEDSAGLDDLIIVDVQFADRAGNLWADRDRMCVDKGVIRGLELTRMYPPENAGNDNDEKNEQGDYHKPRSTGANTGPRRKLAPAPAECQTARVPALCTAKVAPRHLS